ncbi:MAG TPA: hypothetical protein VHE35_14915 [Kofleriaceae bacterium]|nr:hypothetical protein [Kofleriaceae bacterium]
MGRYRRLFGALGDPLQKVEFQAGPMREGGWNADGQVTDNDDWAPVHVTLTDTGAIASIVVKETVPHPPPGSVCDKPGLALDDPRVRAAVVGQTTQYGGDGGPQRVTFTDADIASIRTAVVRLHAYELRRVIIVELQRGLWTAYLDADTGALISFLQNFAT